MGRAAGAPPVVKEDGYVKYGIKGKLSKNEIALLERYKTKKGVANITANTIDEVIADNIDTIKEVIDNMVTYGDPKVFKVIPKELDSKIKDYGLVAQEYFGKKSVEMKGQPVYIVPVDYKQCNKCGAFKQNSSFYINYSDSSFGYTNVCKDCCEILFRDYLQLYSCKESLMVVCQKIDTVVVEPVLTKYVRRYGTPKGKEEISNGTFLGAFMSENSSYLRIHNIPAKDSCFCRSNLHGEPFRMIEAAQILPQLYNDALKPQEEDDYDSPQNYRPIRELKSKWGDFPSNDLYWLEDKYNEYIDRCEVEGLSREKLVMQLCHEELDITRAREKHENIKDKLRNFQALMKEADLTPKRQTLTASESQFQSFGTLIKTAEMHGPIISKNNKFEDVDKFKNLWKSIVGAITRTLGRRNEYVDVFEKSYESYSADFKLPEDDGGEVVESKKD